MTRPGRWLGLDDAGACRAHRQTRVTRCGMAPSMRR